jgi:hypothetical protein
MKKIKLMVTGAVAGLAMAPLAAFATLSTEQAAVITAIETLITDLLAAGWGIVLAIFVGLIGFKLFKKVIGRSA